jgi:integrase/recombinase XerC
MNSKRRGKLPERKNIIAFKAFMKDKKKLSPNTLDLYHTTLKIFFDWMIENKQMVSNPMNGIKRDQKSHDFMIERLQTHQSKELLTTFDRTTLNGLRDFTMVIIMLTMGLRRVEIVRMNISDVENCRIKIQSKGQFFKNQYLNCSNLANESLKSYMQMRGEIDHESALFVSFSNRAKNQRISPGYISQMVKDHLLTIGINNPKISCHSLRHTCAYDILAWSNDENIVQAQLRHSSINTTHRYTHGLEIEINKGKALEAINEIWESEN